MAYKFMVLKAKVFSHPNADRLQLMRVSGTQVVVGMDIKDDDLVVFFPSDGRLSQEFLATHKLRRCDGGYFSDSGRIETQRFRGERSEGFVVPISYLATYMDTNQLYHGQVIEDSRIAYKLETRATVQGKKQQKTVVNAVFPKHVDTEQWRFATETLQRILERDPEAMFSITQKLHGTSGRCGRAFSTKRPETWMQRLLAKVGLYPKEQLVVVPINGTRNTLVSIGEEVHRRDEPYRVEAANRIMPFVRDGELWYFEIVGFEPSGKPIMPPHMAKDKNTIKKYGERVVYHYGQGVGTFGVYVYRIIQTSPDGSFVELSTACVKTRCEGIANVAYVPEIASNRHAMFVDDELEISGVPNDIESLAESMPDYLSTDGHPLEGVVVRVDHRGGTEFFKYKTFLFRLLEGIIKSDDSVVDTEEVN